MTATMDAATASSRMRMLRGALGLGGATSFFWGVGSPGSRRPSNSIQPAELQHALQGLTPRTRTAVPVRPPRRLCVAVDDAEHVAFLVGQRFVRVGKVAHAEQLVRVAEDGDEALRSSTRRAASTTTPSMLSSTSGGLGHSEFGSS